MRFKDRHEAGRFLAVRLAAYADRGSDAVVLALPRGGVPVGLPLTIPALEQGPQMAHRVRTGRAPPHPGALEPLADDRLARRFDRTGADRLTFGPVARVVHPVHLVAEVTHHVAVCFLGRRTHLAAVELMKLRPDRLAPFVLHEVAPL